MKNMWFLSKNGILHNYFLNRVWPETTITVKFALKTASIPLLKPQTCFFSTHFVKMLTFWPKFLGFVVFWTPKTDFSATFGLKSPFPQARANKTMHISFIKPQKHQFSNHFLKKLIFSIPILIDFINRYSTLYLLNRTQDVQ